MKRGKFLVLLSIFLALQGCTHETPPVSELDYVMDRCELSSSDLYMVNLDAWYRGSGVSGAMACQAVHVSLLEWRTEHGDDWGFLNNPADKGPAPSLEDFVAVGIRVWGEEPSRRETVVFDAVFDEIIYMDGDISFTRLNDDGVKVSLDPVDVDDIKGLVVGTVAGWSPTGGWVPEPSSNSSTWVPWETRDGSGWDVTVCTEDHGLYRFDSLPELSKDFSGLFATIWAFTQK